MRVRLFVLLFLILPVAAFAGLIKAPVTADAGISSVVGRMDENSGASVTVPIRQNQCWQGFETKAYLFTFDTEPLRGVSVERAWLNIFLARGDLYGVGLCTVLADWEEGGGVNGRTGRGGASWNWAREPEEIGEPAVGNYWSWPGSGVYSVSWAHPDARYSHAGPAEIGKKKLEEGRIIHLRIPVARELVEAVAQGLACGLLLTDDKGQVAESYGLKGIARPYRYDESQDIYLYTKDIQDPALRPFLEVESGAVDKTPPGGLGPVEVVSTQPGDPSVTVSFRVPADDGTAGGPVLGYEASFHKAPIDEDNWENAATVPLWAVPKPEAPGGSQKIRVFTLPPGDYHLAIRAVDEAGNRGPVSSIGITIPHPPEVSLPATDAGAAAGESGEVVFENSLTVWACPDLCKVDPVSGDILLDGENYRPAGSYSQANPVWSGASRTVSLRAARGEVVAFQMILGRTEGSLSNLKVSAGDLTGKRGKIRARDYVSLFRVWYLDVVPRKEELSGPWERIVDKDHQPAWHGDACLPLEPPFETGFDLPTMDNMGGEQQYQSVWADIFIPPKTRPGTYQGRVSIIADQLSGPAVVNLEIEVLPLEIPGRVTWPVELNTYSGGGRLKFTNGLDLSDDYERCLGIERSYYQLAHKHRTTLNVLPYDQSGTPAYGAVPVLEGSGADTRVGSWKEWDRRWGQYYSGKAFTPAQGYKGPGQGVPVYLMYLPFNDNWPMPIEEYYGDRAKLSTRAEFAEWAKTSRSPYDSFSLEYKEGFKSVVSQFFRHFRKKGYTQTYFQFYYNSKYYWKLPFFGGMGRTFLGSSYWLLDEPVDYDDYLANRFLLSLAKEGCERSGADQVLVQYRTDVSQIEMSRGLWDGYCNLWNSSGLLDFKSTAMFRMRRLPGEEYWKYGGAPKVSGRMGRFQSLFINLWAMGATGVLPSWENIRGHCWFKPDDLAVIYEGGNYARTGKTSDGGFASVRLKAMRRAQQDIEYLNLLAAKKGWDFFKVSRALAPFADDPDAGAAGMSFENLSSEDMLNLRSAVVKALLEE